MRARPAIVGGAVCMTFAIAAVAGPRDTLTFHGDPQRTGWRSAERELTHASVAGPDFGLAWESPQFDAVGGQPPRVYASPLCVDAVKITAGEHAGGTFAAIFAATSNGFVYAVNAFETNGVAPGTILWRTALGAPCKLEPTPLDGVLTGVLSTPVIDLARLRLYVTSCVPERRWQAYALDLASGQVVPGWPVRLDEGTFNAPGMNKNAGTGSGGPPKRFDYRVQRGALSLSPGGGSLYVTFGETVTGWLVAVDTALATVRSAFATVAEPHHSSGGIWGAGGPALDGAGNIFVVTGTAFSGYVDQARDWVQSVVKLSDSESDGLALRGTYTPFNHCETAKMDIDLGSGGITLLPDLSRTGTRTPHVLAVGGKQGNVYLLDRAHMPGRLDRRPPCSADSSSDASLLAPGNQPQFGKRGPLNVFGPYSEEDAALDLARGRSVPAYFRARDDVGYLFVTGNTKHDHGSPVSVPPSLARLRVVARAREPAYVEVDQLEQTLVFENPGSPVVTSHGSEDAIVWVLDENARRTVPLQGETAPQPVLYALGALDFKVLWRSGPGELHTSGKYNEPAFARGSAFVGTDRIQAFSAARRIADGKAIYQQRCAACHDNPEGRIPPRELFANRPGSYLVEVLTDGVMREQAQGLSAAQIRAVARYVAQPVTAR